MMHYQILQQVPALLLNYRQATSLNAPFLGDYDLYQHKFNETFIIRKVVNTSEYTPEELGVLDKLLVLPHPNLLKVLGYEKLDDNDSFQIFFEGIEGSLQDDISSRSKLSKNYTDRELLEMLKKLTEVLVYLEKFQIPHKQITLDSIFITSKGEPKLVHPLMVGSRVPTYHKLLQKMQDADMKYLPSEAVSCLMERKIFPDTDPYKEDIYSLGMCFLEAARVNAKVEQSSLSKSAKLDDTKGVKIMPIIAKMLDENPQRRVDASLLTQMLSVSQDMNDYSPSKLTRYDENDCASPRLSTGTSINEIRRQSPSFQRSQETFEQRFSGEKGEESDDLQMALDMRKVRELAEIVMKSDLETVRELLERNRERYLKGDC